MDNKYKNIGCAVGGGLLLLMAALFFTFIMLVTLDITYTEKEWFKYHLFTSDEIKQAPRLTHRYEISVKAQDGNAAGLSSITFHGTRDGAKLEHYLISLGYYPVTEAEGGKIWYSPDGERSAQVYINSENSVSLIIYDEGDPRSVRHSTKP
ncbi:hypothetical protein C7M51_04218 [Mixta intestinalis]|uniref:Uncharacterized protein n=2 Tax=Mixta intestinalis TaxID=1615494 RepID=A0A6P1Q468_9GAMM|nr:hypothetical protein C7M51_04218 [Mixta intestinalis]